MIVVVVVVMKRRSKVAENMIHSSDVIMVQGESPKKKVGGDFMSNNSLGLNVTKKSNEWSIEDIENNDY